MATRHEIVLAVALAAALSIAPAIAAAAPETSPQQIEKLGFESIPSELTLGPVVLSSEPAPGAYWGATSKVHRSGGKSLWCAGTTAGATPAPSTFWPTYPAYGATVDQTNERVTFSGGIKRLAYKGASGNAVANLTVRSETGTLYKRDQDYRVSVDTQGYTVLDASPFGSRIKLKDTVLVSYKWPTSGTRGQATLRLPQLKNYYRTWVSLYYLMPSLGSRDANSFSIHWVDDGKPNVTDSRYGFAKTTTWKSMSHEMSAGSRVPLSRASGELRFQFFDFVEGRLEKPKNGQGVSIDDVAISGYKYGPPRDLKVSVNGNSATLSWTKPQRSVNDATADERSISYRVWRRESGSSTWSELTSNRITGTQFTDSSRQSAVTYVYVVQAWDTGSGSGYGEYREWKVSPTGQSTRVALLSLSTPPSTPKYAQSLTLSGVLKDASSVPLKNRTVELQRSSDKKKWTLVGKDTTSTNGGYSFSTSATRKTYYRVRFVESEFGTTYSTVRTVLPKVSLTTPKPSTTTMRSTSSYATYGHLKPRHGSGTYPVKVQAYRYQSGKWVLRKTFSAKASNYSSYTKYSAKVKLPYTGKWRIRAYHAKDSLNAATYSSWRYVKVK